MDKSNKKKISDPQKAIAVKKIAEDFGCSTMYVYKSINGQSESVNSLEIVRAYNELRAKLEKALA